MLLPLWLRRTPRHCLPQLGCTSFPLLLLGPTCEYRSLDLPRQTTPETKSELEGRWKVPAWGRSFGVKIKWVVHPCLLSLSCLLLAYLYITHVQFDEGRAVLPQQLRSHRPTAGLQQHT